MRPGRSATRSLRLVLLVGLSCAACRGTERRAGPPPAALPPLVDTASAAKAHAGAVVRVRGEAVAAKLAAAVRGPDLLVYCLDRPGWEAALRGRTVEVTGILRLRDEFQARQGARGEISQGTDAPVWAMDRCEARAVAAAPR